MLRWSGWNPGRFYASRSRSIDRRAMALCRNRSRLRARRQMNTYSTTKAAVLMFSQGLRADWARHHVGVTAICPGVISTPITEHMRLHGGISRREGLLQQIVKGVGPVRSPDRVAKAALNAARRDPGVVMVGIEGHLGHHGRYLLPRPVQEAFARSGLVDW